MGMGGLNEDVICLYTYVCTYIHTYIHRKYKGELDEMMQRVQRAESSEADSKSELSELLSAHDQLQDKWREASRTMAAQSQRHITDLREQVGRLHIYMYIRITYVHITC